MTLQDERFLSGLPLLRKMSGLGRRMVQALDPGITDAKCAMSIDRGRLDDCPASILGQRESGTMTARAAL